jgi:hypothetical protein
MIRGGCHGRPNLFVAGKGFLLQAAGIVAALLMSAEAEP